MAFDGSQAQAPQGQSWRQRGPLPALLRILRHQPGTNEEKRRSGESGPSGVEPRQPPDSAHCLISMMLPPMARAGIEQPDMRKASSRLPRCTRCTAGKQTRY